MDIMETKCPCVVVAQTAETEHQKCLTVCDNEPVMRTQAASKWMQSTHSIFTYQQ